MMRLHTSLAVLALLLVVACVPTNSDAQSFTRLGTGGGTTSPQRISADGTTVIGYRRQATGNTDRQYFVWTDATGYSPLPLPGGFKVPNSNRTMGVSGDGSVVAGSVAREEFDFNASSYELARWGISGSGASLSIVGTPGSSEAFAYEYDVSADGSTIVGVVDVIPNSQGNTSHYIPTRWVNGVGETLDVGEHYDGNALAASANGDIVVGYVGSRAARWTGAGLEVIGPAPAGDVFRVWGVAVDASGLTVLIRSWVSGAGSAIGLWTPDGYIDLPDVPGFPRALSADGSVVATSAGLWTAEAGFQTLADLLEDAGLGDEVAGIDTGQMSIRDLAADGRTFLGTISQGSTVEPFVAYLGPVEDDIIVTETSDEADATGGSGRCDADENEAGDQCTLRAAIETANVRAGRDSVSFNIELPGPHTISVGAALPEVTEPVIIDATTQPGYDSTPLVVVDGAGLDGDGIHLSAGMSVVRGLAVGGFTGAGIRLSGPGEHVVERSFIGVTADGVTPIRNGTGILIDDSKDNLIGGEPTDPETRLGNLVSGNVGAGILISGAASTGNVIKGNRIGTGADGLQAVPNGGAGVHISGAEENLVGGETNVAGEGAGNLISGNTGEGVRIEDADGSPAGMNQVSGNMIGLDVTGDVILSNESHGIQVRGNAAETVIGGEQESFRNVVTGNSEFQIWIEDGDTHAPVLSVVAENYVGVNRDGTAIFEQIGYGMAIGRDSGALFAVGVRAVEVRNNLVAGYQTEIAFYGQHNRGALIIGNRVGLLANDDVARDEPSGSGIVILGGSLSEIGRPDEGNTIAGMDTGLVIAADSVTVVGNRIGTNPAGTLARPNLVGIEIMSELYVNGFREIAETGRRNVIGELDATSASEDYANVISANSVAGISIGGILRLNRDPGKSGGEMLHRTASMVAVSRPATSVAGKTSESNSNMNLAAADSNLIAGNYIGVSIGGIGDLGNALGGGSLLGGVVIERGQGNQILGNIIGNNRIGIMLKGTEHPVRGTTIDYNYIGVSPRGEQEGTPKPNQTAGIVVLAAVETKIGAPLDGLDRERTNVIAHNAGRGVLVYLRSTPTEPELRNLFYRNQFRDNDLEAISYVDVNTNSGADIEGIPMEPRLFLATASQGGEAASVYVNSPESADLEIFLSTRCDPSGRGEGEFYAQTVPSAAGQTQRVFFTDLLDRALTEIGQFVTATATIGDVTTSEFSVCSRIVDEDDTSIEYVEPGETGIITADNGIQVEIQASGVGSPGGSTGKGATKSDEGDLFVARIDGAPVKGPFSGEAATSGDGALVVPTVVSDNRYWTMTSDGLTDVIFKVCVDITDLPGANVPGQLVLAMREHLGMPWTPLNSTYEGPQARLCAEGIESFGEIAIAGNADVNPVPVEPAPDVEIPSAFAVSLYPTPAVNTAVLEVEMPERESIRIEVIDLTGRSVAMVFEGVLEPGIQRFDLPVSRLSSGLYLVRISGRSFEMTRKLVLAR